MPEKHILPTLDDLKEWRLSPRNLRHETKSSLSKLDKFALSITRKVGTMGFFFVLTLWTVGWLVWNLLAPADFRFDPAPAFVIWIFLSNMLQLVLLPLIMVGQTLEGKVADKRAQADFEVNKKSEEKIEIVIAHLENQTELLKDILKKNS